MKQHKACERKYEGYEWDLELRQLNFKWLARPGPIYTSFPHQYMLKYGQGRFSPMDMYKKYIDGPPSYRGTIKLKYAMWDWIIRELKYHDE